MARRRRKRSPSRTSPDGDQRRYKRAARTQCGRRRQPGDNDGLTPLSSTSVSPTSPLTRLADSRFICSDHDDEESSLFSDFDDINEIIQEFLLDDSDSSDSDDECFTLSDVKILRATHPSFCSVPRGSVQGGVQGRGNTSVRQRRRAPGAYSARKRPLLRQGGGPQAAPLSIVVDLDETLVASRAGSIHLRPHIKEFIDACHAEGCEIVIWSAATPSYVNAIVRAVAAVSQRRVWYHHIITRHHSWYRENCGGVKDLSELGRPLGRVLLLENSTLSIQRQPQNSILVEDYIQPNLQDNTLHILAGIVRRVATGMRCRNGGVCDTVARLLSVDPELQALSFLVSLNEDCASTVVEMYPTRAEISCWGLRYSPQALLSQRRYGGTHPLVVRSG
uniref:Mitochondrial import inner membrane translocase subunit TIM50 n=1 Tax=Trypanosoma congolense (strain IL3000) TaxID=1068625 RepID=G0UKQ4_TRYCI|nr:conserved hypothetical protein [Trypanosoma congolense IL3000]